MSPAPAPVYGPPNVSQDPECGIYGRVAAKLRQRGDVHGSSSFRRAEEDSGANFFDRMGMLCLRYKLDEPSYTPEGRRALQMIRPILAHGLQLDMQMNPWKPAFLLRANWLGNHPEVYREAGVFQLHADDRNRILRMAKPSLMADPMMGVEAFAGGTLPPFESLLGMDTLSKPYRAAADLYGK